MLCQPLKLVVFIFIQQKQLTERERQLQEERRKVLEKKKFEDQEKARIKAKVKNVLIYIEEEISLIVEHRTRVSHRVCV